MQFFVYDDLSKKISYDETWLMQRHLLEELEMCIRDRIYNVIHDYISTVFLGLRFCFCYSSNFGLVFSFPDTLLDCFISSFCLLCTMPREIVIPLCVL